MVLATALICLAANVYHEARGEPMAGQVAVALVTRNRVKVTGRTVCSVVLEKKQFSWTVSKVKKAKGRYTMPVPKDKEAWERSLLVAQSVLVGMYDYTSGATHFHERNIRPLWASSGVFVGTWGNHHFYRKPKGVGSDASLLLLASN